MTAPGQFLLAIDIEWQAGESVSGCRCRLCEPGPLNDDLERACVETVREHGWQVNLVGAGDGDDEPAFAYTVGLGHRARHPELVMSGLPSDLMHRVLNAMVERIAAGHRFDTPGSSSRPRWRGSRSPSSLSAMTGSGRPSPGRDGSTAAARRPSSSSGRTPPVSSPGRTAPRPSWTAVNHPPGVNRARGPGSWHRSRHG
jgi:hypothetical protein